MPPSTGPRTSQRRQPLKTQVDTSFVITDGSGQVLERQSYDAFGTRRVATDWTSPLTALTSLLSTRGFTGHEQLDGVELIHMNGRVYDPVLGRFLSADPRVQYPESAQGLNRYSYVDNNPLSRVDPSGYGYFRPIGSDPIEKWRGQAVSPIEADPIRSAAHAVRDDSLPGPCVCAVRLPPTRMDTDAAFVRNRRPIVLRGQRLFDLHEL